MDIEIQPMPHSLDGKTPRAAERFTCRPYEPPEMLRDIRTIVSVMNLDRTRKVLEIYLRKEIFGLSNRRLCEEYDIDSNRLWKTLIVSGPHWIKNLRARLDPRFTTGTRRYRRNSIIKIELELAQAARNRMKERTGFDILSLFANEPQQAPFEKPIKRTVHRFRSWRKPAETQTSTNKDVEATIEEIEKILSTTD